MAYNGNIELISGLKQKNNGTFPLARAHDVYIDDNTRLDELLISIQERISNLQEQIEIIAFGSTISESPSSAYNGNIELISGIIPKNDGDFPLLKSDDIFVNNDQRLSDVLTEFLNELTLLENNLISSYEINTNGIGEHIISTLGNESSVAPGGNFTMILTPEERYKINIVTVTVNGVDVSVQTYNKETGIIDIKNIHGTVIITATAKEIAEATTYNMTLQLRGCYSLSYLPNQLQVGYYYSLKVIPYEGKTISIDNVQITVDGINKKLEIWNQNTLTAGFYATGDTVIKINATGVYHTVTYNLTNCQMLLDIPVIEQGEMYNNTIEPYDGYWVDSVKVTMNGGNVTSDAVNDNEIQLKVGGNIEIRATAIEITEGEATSETTYSISAALDGCELTNSASTIQRGCNYHSRILIGSGYYINDITVIMDNRNITDQVFNSTRNEIYIQNVTGNIAILASTGVDEVPYIEPAIEEPSSEYIINYNLTHCSINGRAPSIVEPGQSCTIELNPEQHYVITIVRVLMNGTDITRNVYDPSTYTIYIAEMEPNIQVIATASYVEGEVSIFGKAIFGVSKFIESNVAANTYDTAVFNESTFS